MTDLLPSQLRELLRYNPKTGHLFWKGSPARCVKAGSLAGNIQRSNGYRYICVGGRSIRAHRIAWAIFYGAWPADTIDHINGIRDDNRIENLRNVTRTENAQNERKARVSNKSTGLLGAYRVGNKFRAIIHVDGKPKDLGRFDSAEDAHTAYLLAKRRFHAGCTI